MWSRDVTDRTEFAASGRHKGEIAEIPVPMLEPDSAALCHLSVRRHVLSASTSEI
jgi:hypothetical protein